ncbi:3'(2'),5'-bisphosphate nucleotidase CysQ [Pararhizobium sp.]|uniref:3'(2'),5'-bisphosphate nucleotidase CysQ n=1 Tax=Pararhizobium sp. TaxID=1977563 RepID=UPI00271A7596|nr:3'(2'),5'-bisphosphate nucleotidase CysQ [Pararhizobium sp.]MDO9415038.1 3'(2'),5'-bisphosphate nucleotidase CysQ [Pararhizobium sp.]
MLDILERAAIAAGKAILEIYEAGPEVALKPDTSPVTDADQRAEAIILSWLATYFPDIPVVAEEAVAAGNIPDISGKLFFLVDPLDGTKEFIGRHNDFTVNIALIENGIPITGVIYAPALGVAYSARGGKAEKFDVTEDFERGQRLVIGCRGRGDKITALASRSHDSHETREFLHQHGIDDYSAVGSSLKFCLLAEGVADIYPRFSRTMEWDTAAGDAILRAAGGETLTMDGVSLTYGKRNQATDVDFANPFFVSRGK